MTDNSKKIGLILTGGGARAAYQVGVLKAVSELLGDTSSNPFPIVCGTSAGAIAAGLTPAGRGKTQIIPGRAPFIRGSRRNVRG